jgi:hypothetical protein
MKTIKTLFCLALIFTFYTNVNAQKNKCKFDVEKKDEFTGADYKSVKVKMLVKQNLNMMMYNFEFFKNGPEFKLQVNYPMMGNVRDIIPLGQELLIKLVSGELLHLKSIAETVPTQQVSGESVYSTYMIPFAISSDELIKMSNSAPTNYKFAIGTLNVQNVINEKDGQKILNVCKCLTQ